jgi:3-oxoacyl-[acyl-carrier-protein] synthase II
VRRVVITGMGAVTPLGNDLQSTWAGLVAGRSGIAHITQFDTEGFDVRIAGELKGFSADGYVSPKDQRHMDRSVQVAMVAAKQAIADAGLDLPQDADDPRREELGIYFGSASGGFRQLLLQQEVLQTRGPGRVSPFYLPHFIADTASGVMAIEFGAEGPNMAVVSACSTGGHAIGEGYECIRRGDAEVIISGGTEAGLVPVMFAGFINMKALANDDAHPERASKPFDARREGFVMSEGAGVLVLEELERARERGARIYAEVVGYGAGNDAFHLVQPRADGVGAEKTMRAALRKAKMAPEEVDYINPHGSGTPFNDRYETMAVKRVFGEHAYKLAMSSTKSMIGHLFGAAGAVEAIASIMTIHSGCIPPTINLEVPDPECDLDYVPNTARSARVNVAMSNSFGLGGHNSSVLFRRLEN